MFSEVSVAFAVS